MISTALYSRLSTDAGVTALVGTRIYPQRGPENATYPLVLYQMIDSGPVRDLASATDHFRTLMQIESYATTQLAAEAIAAAVRASLDYKINQTWGGVSIPASRFDDQFDSGFDEGSNLHRIIQQYRISYKET